MTERERYDVVVVGGGPGGYTAAFRAADLGLSVCLVEKREVLGGVCLNEGCIPSKTLLHGTSYLKVSASALEYGVHISQPSVDIVTLRKKKDKVVRQLTDSLEKLCKARKIYRLKGEAYFHDKETVSVKGAIEDVNLKFNYAIIATGSSPFDLPGFPVDSRIWNSSDALKIKTIPRNLLIIGGGVIGLEMAQVYSALGSNITIVEMEAHVIPQADKDIIQPLVREINKKCTIHTRSKITALSVTDEAVLADFDGPKGIQSHTFDAVLVAVGRKANSSGFGLSNVGIKLSSRGYIECDKSKKTSVPNFYGVGDVTGEPMLAHKATSEGKVAAENIAGLKRTFSSEIIPSVAYTDPELAWVGVTEKEAKEKGIKYSKGKVPWGANGRALSSDSTAGATKLLFEKQTKKIIGAAICGSHAGELINEAALAIEKEATATEIGEMTHAHPTFAETIGIAAEAALGITTETMPPRKR